jgi:proteasome lid subunit RPN8/RPN11
MLIHVLRFGNKARDPRDYREVMGMLIGHLEGSADQRGIQNVIVEDAVPISHGGSIEVNFAPQDYVAFATVDENFAEKNWWTVGWYHSHPGLGIFFSGTDINNQLGWQTPNASAIGIVFDHTFLENPGDLGFRTFRLDDPSKGSRSDYHEVETIVEPPDNVDYYFKLMELIEKIHSKEPPIMEINEAADPFGEINFPSQNEILAKKPELHLPNILSALQDGISKFLQLSVEPLIEFLNSWSQNTIKNVIDNNIQMRKDLIALKDIMTQGINNLKDTIKFEFTDKLSELEIYVDDRLEDFDKDHEVIKSTFDQLKTEFNILIENLFQEKIKKTINEILENFDEGLKSLAKIDKNNIKNSEDLERLQDSLSNLSEKTKSIENLTLDEIGKVNEKFKGNFVEKIDNIKTSLNEINKQGTGVFAELDEILTEFKSSKDSIQDKIKSLEKEKKELLNDLKKFQT